jgi:hypothetical protein
MAGGLEQALGANIRVGAADRQKTGRWLNRAESSHLPF